MNLQAKVLPQYFDELKSGKKTSELRQFENITLINSETGEQICFDVVSIKEFANYTKSPVSQLRFKSIQKDYPNVEWMIRKPIYKIELGDTKLKPRLIAYDDVDWGHPR